MLTDGSSRSHGGLDASQVSLVTDDASLSEQVDAALARSRIALEVGATPEAALRLLGIQREGLCIIDLAARRILPPSFFDAAVLVGLSDELLLTRRVAAEEDRGRESYRLACWVYPRGALEELTRHLAEYLGDERAPADAVGRILGESSAIALVREQIRSVARFADVPVLVLGETGTGKELVARALHESTVGPEAPFVAINCAAIPENLFESELFGHEAGAYTGARGARVGLLEAAAGGTVFLDEVGEMPSSMQPKLLRVLESRELRRVGSNRMLALRARIVSATNRNPWLSGPKPLRPDLLYRLAGFTLRLPPLRERPGDIAVLTRHFVAAFAQRYHTPSLRLTREAIELLEAHQWPGNIRELRVVAEHACIVSKGGAVTAGDVRAALAVHRRNASEASSARPASGPLPLRPRPGVGLRDLEKEIIREALRSNDGNVSRTAKQLGIPRSTLRAKLKRMRES